MGQIVFRLAACCLLAAASSLAFAAPSSELWARWEKHDPTSTAIVDHSLWDSFLEHYRSLDDGIALIDYAAVSTTGRKELQDYLSLLGATDVDSLNRDEQQAYWINLYNALTVETILANYPVDSIRDISGGFLSSGPWDDELFSVAGETLTLNDIEHRILRPIWRDARLHYAVNCASLGCPNVAATAFTAANTEQLLDQGAADYINHPRGAAVADGKLAVSSIYDWFVVDFGDDDESVIEHLKLYAEEPLLSQLADISSIDSFDYDWSLNQP